MENVVCHARRNRVLASRSPQQGVTISKEGNSLASNEADAIAGGCFSQCESCLV